MGPEMVWAATTNATQSGGTRSRRRRRNERRMAAPGGAAHLLRLVCLPLMPHQQWPLPASPASPAPPLVLALVTAAGLVAHENQGQLKSV